MADGEEAPATGDEVLELLSPGSDAEDNTEGSDEEQEESKMYYSHAGSDEEGLENDSCRTEGTVDDDVCEDSNVPGPSVGAARDGVHDQEIGQSGLEKGYENRWMQNLKEFLSRPVSAPIAGQSVLPPHPVTLIKTEPASSPPATTNKEVATPMDAVKLFLDDSTLEYIMNETNRYAVQALEAELASGEVLPFSAARRWTMLTMEELYNFLAILLHMAVVSKTDLNAYWSTDPVMYSAFTCKLMARDRFRNVMSFLHLNDNTVYKEVGEQGHDPAFKVRPLFDMLSRKFEEMYAPSEHKGGTVLCWTGRFQSKVYAKERSPRRGVKLFELSDLETRYVWRLELTTGRKDVSSKPQDVLSRLVQPLLADSYTIYMDKYNIYPPVVDETGVHAAFIVESVRTNLQTSVRGDQSDKLNKKGHVIALKCRDQATHSNSVIEDIARDKRRRLTLGSILNESSDADQDSQMLSSVTIVRKSVKWWKRLFFHLFSLVMINAQVVYNQEAAAKGKKKMVLQKFYCEVARAFAREGTAAAHPDRETCPPSYLDRLTGRHFPSQIPAKPGHIKRPTRVCKVCRARARCKTDKTVGPKKMRKESSYMCKECNVSLCVTPCFGIWHTEEDI